MLGQKYITPDQCRAARSLLGWTREQLAAFSSVSKMTLADFETGKRQPYPRTLDDITAALRAGGVVLLDAEEQHGSGVRFAQPNDQAVPIDQVPAAMQARRP